MVCKENIIVSFLIVFHFMHFKTFSLSYHDQPKKLRKSPKETQRTPSLLPDNAFKRERGLVISSSKARDRGMKLPLVSRCCADRWHVQVKHVQFTDVLGGGVVCAANEDPARERKGFVVDRSWNVNVYASYGKKKFHDSYKEKRGTKTCDDGQKKRN